MQSLFTVFISLVTEPPEILMEHNTAKVLVPVQAANSIVGFTTTEVIVNQSKITIVTNSFL